MIEMKANQAQTTKPSVSSTRNDAVAALLGFLFILALCLFALHQMNAPDTVSASAPANEFSSDRAMRHLQVIAQRPHPLGTAEHDEVRDYIVRELSALGLTPQVQTTMAMKHEFGDSFSSATVQNVIARLSAENSGKAILLVAHYDTVPNSSGANDDGTAVAAMLETARALGQNPPLKNDIIFLFTDAGDSGLLGAKAFLDEHPWMKDVRLALNFEARGRGGPTILFETSPGNGKIISEFAKAAPYPLASSAVFEIYKRLRLETDLSVFEREGIAGLNFAYVNDPSFHHNQLDNLTNADERSLSHDGYYALSLARHFGNLNLEDLVAADEVYFDLFSMTLVHYSKKLVIPLVIAVALLSAALAVRGLRTRRLTLKGSGLGLIFSVLSLVLIPVVMTLLWYAVLWLRNGSGMLQPGNIQNSQLLIASFIALTLCISSILHTWLRKRVSLMDMTLGGLVLCLTLSAVISLIMPGASYLFTLPLFFSIAAFAYLLHAKEGEPVSAKRLAILFVCAVPGIVLLVPIIRLISVGLNLGSPGPLMAIVVLLLVLLTPQMSLISAPSKSALPTFMAFLFLILFMGAMVNSRFSPNNPKANNVFYIMDADSNKAIWASFDGRPDQWTSQFFSQDAERGSIVDYFPMPFLGGFLKDQAPPMPYAAPDVELIENSMVEDGRRIRIRIKSRRHAPVIFVHVYSDTNILDPMINGKPLAQKLQDRWIVHYHGLPEEGFELSLRKQSPNPIKIRAIDISYGLPEPPNKALKPRPDNMMAAATLFSDVSMVNKNFTF